MTPSTDAPPQTDPPLTDTPPPARAPQPPPADTHLTVIENRSGWSLADFREMWRFRELFYYLTLRDIKLRYKQTVLGVGWSVFQPIATILVFVVFIGILGKAKGGMEQAEYLLFVVTGVLPWTFFATAVTNAGNSLISNERLVSKTYFPRLALPAANVFAALFDFTICMVLLAVTLVCFGVAPTWQLLLLPVAVGVLVILATAFGVLLSALIASQRDFRFLLNFGVQLWMFATPCIYLPADAYGETAKRWLLLNPVNGLVVNFRAAVLGTEYPLDFASLGLSAAVAAGLFAMSLVYFKRVDRTLADSI